VDRETFEAEVSVGGFLEWAEYLGNLYGTPIPSPPRGFDVLLEIDLQGAEQVKRNYPDAVVVLLLPPSSEVQEARLRSRGDDEDHVARRMVQAAEEEAMGRRLADYVVVNNDLDQATGEVAGILEAHRLGRGRDE
jgi:guanylate kinase